jgi:transcriptional regulator with XRE-family HTH domain
MWKRGEKAELAAKAGISKSHLSNILARRTRAKAELALTLAKVCREMGVPITREDWAFNKETENSFFSPKVV